MESFGDIMTPFSEDPDDRGILRRSFQPRPNPDGPPRSRPVYLLFPSVPMTPDELDRIIRRKENARVEFKAQLSNDVLRGLSTDIAAFFAIREAMYSLLNESLKETARERVADLLKAVRDAYG